MAMNETANAGSIFRPNFGAQGINQQPSGDRRDLPKAEFWINIGYMVDYPLADGGTERRLVSLPVGIALDTMEPLTIGNSRNAMWVNFQSARNDLRDTMIEEAKKLAPGEDMIIGDPDNGLVIQIRRVNEPATATASDDNPFAFKAGTKVFG